MKAIVLTADGVEDLEFFYPYYRLMEAGIEVDVATPRTDRVQGKHGYPIPANMTFEDVDPDDYDLLLLPGGKGPETVRQSEAAREITRKMFDAGKTVAAICHASQILISAGVAKGKHATCWPGVQDDLKAAGAIVEDHEVVVDGNLITSRKPDDLPAFCREIFEALRVATAIR